MPIDVETGDIAESSFRLGEWVVQPRLNRLSRGDEAIQIEHKMMDVLVCLAERPGDLVPRQHIIDTVWAIEFISEGTLTRIVAELRRALGDDAREPRFIETIRGKGYRLLVPVEVEQESSAKIAQFPVRTPDDDRNPYPGLAAFTEADAEFFYGREAEVNDLWRKITSRRLVAVIGPSGVGKTSFLRAGLFPATPEGWGTLICQPGEGPFAALARALAPEISDDPEAVSKLVDFEVNAPHLFSRWRERHDRALLIVDQFEELFTLNTPDVQSRVADLLSTIARKADVHVLLSMRDDFLYRCQAHPPLRPVLEALTALQQPESEALHRTLVEPARRLGFGFESDQLPADMIGEVEGERGALPMLAFAVAWLWEKRDRTRRMITRQAYADIGGVGGALARHAEATIDRIGTERVGVVREVFRNLVTAEGTRAVREWSELLSVFSNSHGESPEEVLRALIDARLLTSYEVREEDKEPTRRVEIIHESLLADWPRLVRWQTQDADAAQLRDQLRQAARTWNEHDRTDDVLWTGKAFREFSMWREDYSGGLTETENAFTEAMIRHAERRKRRRRTAVAATIVVLLGVLAVIGGFWQRSVTEARRAEAAYLFSLAQLRLEEHPTAAVAYAIASLKFADNPEVRRLALDALWRGPTEFRLQTNSEYWLDFSSDGRWLATADPEGGGKLWPSDGGPPTILEGSDSAMEIRFSPRGDLVAANMGTERQELGLWSFPEGRFLRSFALGDQTSTYFFVFSRDGKRLITSTQIVGGETTHLVIRSWPVGGGEPDHLARLRVHPSSNYLFPDVDPTGSRLAWADGRTVRIAPLVGTTLELESATSIEHDRAVAAQIFDPSGLRMATVDTAGRIWMWSLGRDPPELTHAFGGGGGTEWLDLRFDPSGSMLAVLGVGVGVSLWDLTVPPDAEPVRLRRPRGFEFGLTFDPKGNWVATSTVRSVSLWPLACTYPRVLRRHEKNIMGVAFTPDGKRLVSTSEDGSVRVWTLGGSSGERSRVLDQVEGASQEPAWLSMAPNGSFVAVGYVQGQVKVLPLDGGSGRELSGFTDAVYATAVGPEARLVAAGSGHFFREDAIVRVWDLESEEVRILDSGDGTSIKRLEFTGEGDLWVESGSKIRRWNLEAGSPRTVEEIDLSTQEFAGDGLHDLDPDGRQLLLCEAGRLWIENLDAYDSRELSSHGSLSSCSLHADGEIVISTDRLGGIRVGPVTGEEPHLLLGRERGSVAVSPDGQWIASGGADHTIRLWPMPDLSEPPLHTLPRSELIAKLKTLTNLRAVRDETSSTGWKIEVGPFPGWKTVPSW